MQSDARYVAPGAVSPRHLQKQLDLALSETRPAAVKIGMLAKPKQAEVLARSLEKIAWRGPLVWDPIFAASAGGRILDRKKFYRILDALRPFSPGLTPNIPEALEILGLREPIATKELALRLYDSLRMGGSGFILLTGGHTSRVPLEDWLISESGTRSFSHTRILSPHRSRGTGCRLASALAIEGLLGTPLDEAVPRAQKVVERYLERA